MAPARRGTSGSGPGSPPGSEARCERRQGRGLRRVPPRGGAVPAYNDAMAAWRNEVIAMQAQGVLPVSQTPQDAPEPLREAEAAPDPAPAVPEPQGPAEGVGAAPEEKAASDEPRQVFDPVEHTAPGVLEYHEGVGEDEAVRVRESEERGKARKGILNLKDDVLARARENDETGSGSKSA